MFVLGSQDDRALSKASEPADLASLSRDELGGIEYRALRTLLPIATGKREVITVASTKTDADMSSVFLWAAFVWRHLPTPLDLSKRHQI